MKLNDLMISDLSVERNGEFLSIGRIQEKKHRKLVALINESLLGSLSADDNVSTVITTPYLADKITPSQGLVISADPEKTLYKIHNSLVQDRQFYKGPFDNEIHQTARIHPTAYIAKDSVRIGSGCEIGPNACVLENSILEDHVVVGAGSVIGNAVPATYSEDEKIVGVISTGGVILHADVEIHSNSCVNKAILGGYTEIGEYTKIDNLVQIGENSKLGKRCIVPACASIGANAVIGDSVWIGPNAVISDGVTVGDKAFITLGSVVVEDVAPGQKVTGNFAIAHNKFIELIKKIR